MDIDRPSLDKEAMNRFEQYTLAKPTLNGGIALDARQDSAAVAAARALSSNKNGVQKPRHKIVCCFCIKTTKYRRKQFIISSLTNVGIFIVLLAYAFMGAFIFLAIEGGNENTVRPRILPDRQSVERGKSFNSTLSDKQVVSYESEEYNAVATQNMSFAGNYFLEARSKTVENIWEITVSLNILYRENWTRLAAQEISKFQDELVQRVTAEMASQYGVGYREMALGGGGTNEIVFPYDEHEWNLALAFFYALTVLTTIGYGNIAPRTSLGKTVTMGYALLGIPLTLIYLSSVGSLLSKLARSVFTRALCCCLCSNCGYCCYDERRMAEKERRMKLKRQKEELQNSHNSSKASTEECYVVRSTTDVQLKENFSSDKHGSTSNTKEETISWPDTESKLSLHGLGILAPACLCLTVIFIYMVLGAIVLYELDNMKPLDGFYFCFMALSTIGFGDIVPGTRISTISGVRFYSTNSVTVWFCSAYTLTGLALTAMCFGVIHDEIIHRIKHQQKEWSQKSNVVNDEVNLNDPFYIAS